MTADHVQAGYEDVWYYLWRERQLPVNVDPFDARLDDELERDRLRRVFTQGLDAVVGYALPIRRVGGRGRTLGDGPWFLRGERLYLMPGDSPMGLRLPLDSLPWSAPDDRLTIDELDPFAPRAPLAAVAAAATIRSPPQPQAGFTALPDPAQQSRVGAGATHRAADCATGRVRRRAANRPPDVVRSALCVEPRGGVLYVFMPPVEALEDYLDLVAAVEATARALGMRVLLEGYPPPSDPRLPHFLVTPDPGVIEVNVQPAAQLGSARRADDDALRGGAGSAGLAPEKFMLDGRHTGTGGGNHFVLGGSTPADSPFLRRPDLLRSLIAYWHNHPSLSYLFSGLFLGPTSQAPRIDEARHDSLYELEIAFSRFAPPDSPTPPWFVDRALRHLLVDVTGNTHRAEFCIDKLYSPDPSSGRRGLLEMRAFEMPPHARMSVAQQLLLRALIARFWREPYTAGLTRWGTELHDRFMLPYFVALDFDDVIEELRRRRLPAVVRLVRAASRVQVSAGRRAVGARDSPDAAAGARAVARARRRRRRRRHGAVRRLIARAPAAARHRADRRSLRRSRATAGRCRCSRPGATASTSPASATAPGSRRRRCIRRFRCTRRSRSTSSTPGWSGRSPAASIT